LRANMILDDAVIQAAEVKSAGLKDRDVRVRQAAATEILDRRVGKPTQKTELTGKDGGAIPIELFEKAVSKVYGDTG
jgi:CRP-like cAMP-binding protein